MFRDHAGDTTGFEVQAAHRAARQHPAAAAPDGARQRRRCEMRFGTSVARRVHRAGPAHTGTAHPRGERGGAEDLGVDAEVACAGDPGFVAGKFPLAACREIAAALAEADALADVGFEAAPDPIGGHRDRQFPEIAALLANPAPVAAGLFAGDMAFFADDDVDPALREEPGGGDADDAAADDDDVALAGHGLWRYDRAVPGVPDDGGLHAAPVIRPGGCRRAHARSCGCRGSSPPSARRSRSRTRSSPCRAARSRRSPSPGG